jgi:hypothetical protein
MNEQEMRKAATEDMKKKFNFIKPSSMKMNEKKLKKEPFSSFIFRRYCPSLKMSSYT